jgi:hypothetical protein
MWSSGVLKKTMLLVQNRKELIEKLLLGRLSLRGISRVLGVALTSLLRFMEELYAHSPNDRLCRFAFGQYRGRTAKPCLEVEADEMWSAKRLWNIKRT